MHKKNEQGFTLIELLVIAVIVCILATFVIMAYSGVRAKNRNSTRQANIDTLKSQLEAYYAQYSKYPSLQQLNDANWRTKNLKNLHSSDIEDPQWNAKLTACTVNKQPALATKPTKKCYSYHVTTTDGSDCSAETVMCGQYTLTAMLEGGEKYVKSSLN